jgi:hypothetical protein
MSLKIIRGGLQKVFVNLETLSGNGGFATEEESKVDLMCTGR